MADWQKPTLASTYADFVGETANRDVDLAVAFDPAHALSVVNPKEGTIRWRSAAKKWEKWIGGVWGDLTDVFAINISGNAATATTLSMPHSSDLEIGKSLDFHGADNGFSYDVRLEATAGAGVGLGALAISASNVTAAKFTGAFFGDLTGNVSGSLTGNVTGNVTGSSGSCTGNALTASNGGVTSVNGAVGAVVIPATTWGSISGKPASTNITGNWIWSGQSNLTYLWGSNDGVNHYPVDRAGLSVNYATSATNATNATHATYLQGYVPANFAAAGHGHSYAGTDAFNSASMWSTAPTEGSPGHTYLRLYRVNGSYLDLAT